MEVNMIILPKNNSDINLGMKKQIKQLFENLFNNVNDSSFEINLDNNYKWANIEKCTKSVADRTLFTDIKLLYTFYCPYTADSIVQFFKFAHL